MRTIFCWIQSYLGKLDPNSNTHVCVSYLGIFILTICGGGGGADWTYEGSKPLSPMTLVSVYGFNTYLFSYILVNFLLSMTQKLWEYTNLFLNRVNNIFVICTATVVLEDFLNILRYNIFCLPLKSVSHHRNSHLQYEQCQQQHSILSRVNKIRTWKIRIII